MYGWSGRLPAQTAPGGPTVGQAGRCQLGAHLRSIQGPPSGGGATVHVPTSLTHGGTGMCAITLSSSSNTEVRKKAETLDQENLDSPRPGPHRQTIIANVQCSLYGCRGTRGVCLTHQVAGLPHRCETVCEIFTSHHPPASPQSGLPEGRGVARAHKTHKFEGGIGPARVDVLSSHTKQYMFTMTHP